MELLPNRRDYSNDRFARSLYDELVDQSPSGFEPCMYQGSITGI